MRCVSLFALLLSAALSYGQCPNGACPAPQAPATVRYSVTYSLPASPPVAYYVPAPPVAVYAAPAPVIQYKVVRRGLFGRRLELVPVAAGGCN